MRTYNARFGPDGQIAFSIAFNNPYLHYSLNLQALSWLQGTFRYTRSEDKIFNAFRDGDTLVDRGSDLKFHLLGESKWVPSVALGLQDMLGTGVFSGEYLVASKRYYDFDFSAGIAWGYPGNRGSISNPFNSLSGAFGNRQDGGGRGGNVELGRMFAGDRAALFAGLEWITPISGLRLKLEYEGNDYSNERGGNELIVDQPFNIGFDYSPWPFMTFGVALERGNVIQTRAVLSTALHDYSGVPKLDEEPPAVRVRPPAEAARDDFGAPAAAIMQPHAETTEGVFTAFEARGLDVDEVALTEGQLIIVLEDIPEDEEIVRNAARRAATSTVLPIEAVVVAERESIYGTSKMIIDVRDAVGQIDGIGDAPADTESDAAERMIAGLRDENFKVDAVEIEESRASAYVENMLFRDIPKAIGRAARVMASTAPHSVEKLRVVLMQRGLPVQSTTILRKDMENAISARGSVEEIWANTLIEPGLSPGEEAVSAGRYPDLSWFLTPKLRQHVGRPQAFYKYQFWLQLGGEIELAPGLLVQGSVGRDLYNNFDDLSNNPGSSLQHVRSEIVQYLQKGANNLVYLAGHYLFKPASDVYVRASAGYFEEMFAGYGGEILYRPYDSRWAIGLEVHHVFQREFEQRFGLLKGEGFEYDVITGHVDVYWRTPIHDIDFQISLGRYLAGDDGGTFGIGRRFDSGVTVGGWVTVTDVSAEEFGEGSFDKGFTVTLPYDLFFPKSTKAAGSFPFRPLTRDGGQRLNVSHRLYGHASEGDVGYTGDKWHSFLD